MPHGIPDTTPRFSLNFSPKQNFWDKHGGLPKYIASVATALVQDRGFPREHAIPAAKNRIEAWCTTGHDPTLKGHPAVSKAVQAEACKAIAEWHAKIAQAKSHRLSEEDREELGITLADPPTDPASPPEGSPEEEASESVKDEIEEVEQEIQELIKLVCSEDEHDPQAWDAFHRGLDDYQPEDNYPPMPPEHMMAETDPEKGITLADTSSKSWSGSASNYKDANAYCSACLVDKNPPGKPKTQENCKLPIKEPGGSLNKNGVQAAYAALKGARGGVKGLSPEDRKKAANGLLSAYNKLGLTVPDDLKAMASSSNKMSEEDWMAAATYLAHSNPELLQRLEGGVVYQLPITLSEPIQLGEKWKKPLLKAGSKIRYARDGVDKELDFSREYLAQMAENVGARAFSQIPFLSWHPSNERVDPNDYFGEMVDAEIAPYNGEEWLYGTFDLTDRGHQFLSDNPNLPVSVGYDEDRIRADGKQFGPSIFHIAATYKPVVPDPGGWAPIQLSDGVKKQVVNLTDQEFSHQSREEEVRLSDTQAPAKEGQEVKVEDQNKSVTLSEHQRLLAEVESLRKERERDRAEQVAQARLLAEERVDRRLQTEFASVVPHFRNMMRELILSEAATQQKVNRIELSEDGETTKEVPLQEQLWEIMKLVKLSADKPETSALTVKLGEEGNSDVDPKAEEVNEHERLDRRTKQLMAEKQLSYVDASQIALSEVS